MNKALYNQFIVLLTSRLLQTNMYAIPNIMSIWEIRINPLEHSYFESATRADHNQMTSRMIINIVKNHLRENLEMTVKKARGLVK
jgi:hypothetical protein